MSNPFHFFSISTCRTHSTSLPSYIVVVQSPHVHSTSPQVYPIPLLFHPTPPLFNLHMSNPFHIHAHPLQMSSVSFRPRSTTHSAGPFLGPVTLLSSRVVIRHNSGDVLACRDPIPSDCSVLIMHWKEGRPASQSRRPLLRDHFGVKRSVRVYCPSIRSN